MTDLLVKLQIYEGPLDLLLHLIKKNEIDLNDIPVALITAQYLKYLEVMESLNVEVAADFLVMAATLTQIKSRLLLPHENDDDDENDPVEELKAAIIDPLLEHMRFRGFSDFKEATEALWSRPRLGNDVFVRGQPYELKMAEEASSEQAIEVSLFELVDAFRRLADKKPEKMQLNFIVETKTIAQRISEIRQYLKDKKSGTFDELCCEDRDQGEMVLSFLAILELARTGFLRSYQNLVKTPELRIFLANPDADLAALNDLSY